MSGDSSSAAGGELAVHLLPDDEHVAAAIRAAGGRLVPLDEAEALVYCGGEPLPETLPANVRWVQLPAAGVEKFFASGVIDRDRTWTSAAGAYAATVAEHAVTLLLAGVRALDAAVPKRGWAADELAPLVGSLSGSRVAIVGAGGIGRAIIPQLTVFGAEVAAVNRSGRPVPGAVRTVPATQLSSVWEDVDHVIVAAPATAQTKSLIDAKVLAALQPTSWVVNIARGSLIDTDALLDALDRGVIGGAALDVTDPEPLPDDHPLWSQPRAIITPHVANPTQVQRPALARYVGENIRRYRAGEPLRGVIDVDAGY